MTTFVLRSLEIFWKINLEQIVGIHKNNLDSKQLIKLFCHFSFSFFLRTAAEVGNTYIHYIVYVLIRAVMGHLI